MHWRGLLAAESVAAGICLPGLIVTATMLPETKGKSLEEISQPVERQHVGFKSTDSYFMLFRKSTRI